jgi:hypothetical protein
VADLAVEVDDAFQFVDGPVEFASIKLHHRDVEPGGGLAGPGADLPESGQGLLVVVQRLLPVAETR